MRALGRKDPAGQAQVSLQTAIVPQAVAQETVLLPPPMLKSPITGKSAPAPAWMSDAQIGEILKHTSAAQATWAAMSLEARAEKMTAVGALLVERQDELAALMAKEIGKPLAEGKAEIVKCSTVCTHYAENARRYLEPEVIATDASSSSVRYEPMGVIFAVMPWNYPFWQVFRFAAPNLMLGNGAVLKHADNVPGCAKAIEQLFADAGFPKDLFRTLFVSVPQVKGVIEAPEVKGVTLTGSEAAGRSIGAIAGGALKKAVLELGGSDPFVVLPGADLKRAAALGAKSRCMNAGQTCIAAKRFIIHEEIYDEFMRHFVAEMTKYKAGDPFAADTNLGPLTSHRARKRLHEQVQAVVHGGAKIALGGQPARGVGAYYPPTILTDVSRDNAAAREELFGPVALVFKVKGTEEAVALANDTPFGLGASVWTKDEALIESLPGRFDAGAVFVNGMVKSDPRLPFGGIKGSGFGREIGKPGITEFANMKTVWIA